VICLTLSNVVMFSVNCVEMGGVCVCLLLWMVGWQGVYLVGNE